MITVALHARLRKHTGGWVEPDTRLMTREIVDHQFPRVVGIIGPAGIQGPAGAGGTAPVKIDQIAPAGTWILAHSLARIPLVQVFEADGEQVIADVVVTTSQITVTNAVPVAGFVLAY